MKQSPPPRRFTRRDDSASRKTTDWELALAGDLTDKQTDLLNELLDVEPGSRGTIFFDSCGGSAYTGISLAGLIRLRGLEVTAVVLGECSSAALLPFAACARRFVTPHSSLYFHPVRWSSEENVNLEEAAEWTRHFGILEDEMDQLLAKLLDYPLDKILAWTRPGRFLMGPEFAAAGLAKLVTLFDGDLRSQMARL